MFNTKEKYFVEMICSLFVLLSLRKLKKLNGFINDPIPSCLAGRVVCPTGARGSRLPVRTVWFASVVIFILVGLYVFVFVRVILSWCP